MSNPRNQIRVDADLLAAFKDAIKDTVPKADALSSSALADVAIALALKAARGEHQHAYSQRFFDACNRTIAEKIAEGIVSFLPLAVQAKVTDARVGTDETGWPAVLFRSGEGGEADTRMRLQKEFVRPAAFAN